MLETRAHVRTLTSKGQVTVPAEVRRLLRVGPADKIVFRVTEGRVELQPAPMTLEATFGAVKPLNRPEDFTALRETAIAEHVEKVIAKMCIGQRRGGPLRAFFAKQSRIAAIEIASSAKNASSQ
ncbi:MAG: hypothetical protein CVU38_14610 [Chloroflexi bacterium HGW-Chloroflexi-1]|nr:MAG: hypothetical protein CVU38_14610 [Chloroflexi bacterium HGW-Chloroflexi-1]